jgi:hypothetical protein
MQMCFTKCTLQRGRVKSKGKFLSKHVVNDKISSFSYQSLQEIRYLNSASFAVLVSSAGKVNWTKNTASEPEVSGFYQVVDLLAYGRQFR